MTTPTTTPTTAIDALTAGLLAPRLPRAGARRRTRLAKPPALVGRGSPDELPTVAVYGGGGVFGIAYNLGIAEAFCDAGVDLGAVEAIGTSAGSWAAGLVALGLRFDESYDALSHIIPELPDTTPGLLAGVARDVFGADVRCPSVNVGVVGWPRMRRYLLNGADHELADLVAASSAVPGVLASHRVDGARYVDGGLRAMSTEELPDHPARVLVVLPVSGLMFGVAGRLIERRTVRVVDDWRRSHPGSVTSIVRPTAEVAALVRRPDHLFDPTKMRQCYELAYAQGATVARSWATALAAA